MNIPGLSQLEATPEILRLLMEGLSEEDAAWKPAPDRFSIAEVLEHLSHAEGHCFRLRVERMTEESDPAIEPYDPNVYFNSGQYSGRSAEDSFDHFEEQRELNLQYLRELPASAADRSGTHGNSARLPCRNSCMSGPFTTSATSARLPRLSARSSITRTWARSRPSTRSTPECDTSMCHNRKYEEGEHPGSPHAHRRAGAGTADGEVIIIEKRGVPVAELRRIRKPDGRRGVSGTGAQRILRENAENERLYRSIHLGGS